MKFCFKTLTLIGISIFWPIHSISSPIALPTTFEVIVPLGNTCQPAQQLMHFQLKQEHYGFEWLISDSLLSIASLVLNDFKDFLAPESLMFVTHDSYIKEKYGTSAHILDKRYGLRFVHDFDTNSSFMNHYDKIYAAYQRRIKRFRRKMAEAQKGQKMVLFIRKGASLPEALIFIEIIKKRFPLLNFYLLLIDQTEEVKKEWNIPHLLTAFLPPDNAPYDPIKVGNDWYEILRNVIDFEKQPLVSQPNPHAPFIIDYSKELSLDELAENIYEQISKEKAAAPARKKKNQVLASKKTLRKKLQAQRAL